MLDSIYVGMSGLLGFSQGLRVIANNTANMNTPGFKGSSLGFADLFYTAQGAGSSRMLMGNGLNTTGTTLNLKQGDLHSTSSTMDLAIQDQGMFTLRDQDGNLRYTRDGQFSFNQAGFLVSKIDGSKVMGVDATGALGEITTAGKSTALGKATTNVKFSGFLSRSSPSHTINSVKVLDSLGGEHLLTIQFINNNAAVTRQWLVTVLDGATVVDTGAIVFDSTNTPDPTQATVTVHYAPPGVPPVPFVLDFSAATSPPTGAQNSLDFASQDGFGPGALTNVSFDAQGVLVLTYANGQIVKGQQLALGRFDSPDVIEAVGNNTFISKGGPAWHTGTAGTGGFGSVHAGTLELSNVDLSQEFSDLVIMQRGYQSSSQIVTTANEMLQELFNMRGK